METVKVTTAESLRSRFSANKIVETDWSGVVNVLSRFQGKRQSDHDWPCWAPGVFNGRTCTSVFAMVFDYDDLLPFERVCQAFDAYAGFAHTTKRDGVRVVLSLSRPFTLPEFSELCARFKAPLDGYGRSSSLKPDRFWFVPSGDFQVRGLIGRPVDVSMQAHS